jgi:medium-chain acyl-[acyl-carrier-protein] hydrolase
MRVAQLPGRETRLSDAPLTSIPALVTALTEAFAVASDKPFATFGHSMGAIISFELVRRLRGAYGLEPQQMIVSGCRAPQLNLTTRPIYDLSEPEFIEELTALNGTVRDVMEHPELMQLLIPSLRADFQAIQTYSYSPGPPLDCPLIAFGGLKDTEVTREDLEAWGEQTRGDFKVRMFPGDHFFLHSSPAEFFQTLSQELRRLMSRVG